MEEMTGREHLVYKAKLAEHAERYDEMSEVMKTVAEMDEDLSLEERNLLSVAFKNAVGTRRASWRIISNVEHKEKSKNNTSNSQLAYEYRLKIESELTQICNDILALVDGRLAIEFLVAESKVFYHKMRGDYLRYIAEYTNDFKGEAPSSLALAAYGKATEIAAKDLLPTHPIRLGLALNFSVFFYEIMNQPNHACVLAQGAFDEAISELDNVAEDSYRDCTLIMQLLRDNLALWTSDTAVEKAGEATLEPDVDNGAQPV